MIILLKGGSNYLDIRSNNSIQAWTINEIIKPCNVPQRKAEEGF